MTSTNYKLMRTHSNLWNDLCSFKNLFLAYKKARKRKTKKAYVQEFEKNLVNNLLILQSDLQNKTYTPKPLVTFAIRDPKTRKISKSDFRDRIVHHALCNIIEPIFDRTFIYDSYANRKVKGTLKAIQRFESFKRKITKNNVRIAYVFKADIKHYFETIDHKVLIEIIEKRIVDKNIVELIKIILKNHRTKIKGKGMPLGNLTSQFFANVYLNSFDHYVKEILKIKYYIRYVDDFVVFCNHKGELEKCKLAFNEFLKKYLKLELHPDKSKIGVLAQGTHFLGLRIYSQYRLLAKRNIQKFRKRLEKLIEDYDNDTVSYDKIYDVIEGWVAYSKTANTYNIRKRVFRPLESKFGGEISTKEFNRYLKLQY